MKRDITEILFKALCTLMLLAAGFLICMLYRNMKDIKPQHYCLVKPTVFDALTGEPVGNAVITDAYDGRTYTSDSTGSADWLAVYYEKDTELALSEFIVSAKGYKTTVMYIVTETALSPLDGPVIYLFGGNENETVSMVYSPSDEYSENLRKKFSQNN